MKFSQGEKIFNSALYKLKRLNEREKKDIIYTIIRRAPKYLASQMNRSFLLKDSNFFIDEALEKVKSSVSLNTSFFIKSEEKDEIVSSYKSSVESSKIKQDIQLGEGIISGELNIFGSLFLFKKGTDYLWHHSIDREKFWPDKYYTDINYSYDCNDYGDPKYVWELNRHSHFLKLGRAYWLTNDEKYADEFIQSINSWIIQNPYLYGINWVEGIEVSTRAVSWIWAYEFFSESDLFTESFKISFVSNLYLHGKYLIENLSDKWRVNNNHILSELVGLIYLGNFFYSYDFGKSWMKEARDKLELELNKQIMNDGFLWESSTTYHKFVTELILHASLVLSKKNLESKIIKDKLKEMSYALKIIEKPNGELPTIGDSDDAMLLNFDDNSPNSSEILNSLASYFNDPNLASLYKKTSYNFWLSRKDNMKTKSNNFEKTYLLEDAGLFVYKSYSDKLKIYILFNIGNQHKKHHVAGHRHSDLLSVLININGIDFVVDGGTYKYFDSIEIRRLFKGIKKHSTVSIGGNSLFPLRGRFEASTSHKSRSSIDNFSSQNHSFKINAKHEAYLDRYGTTVSRRVNLNSRNFSITDSSSSKFKNDLVSQYIIPGNLRIRKDNNKCIVLNELLQMKFEGNIKFLNSYYSDSYGQLKDSVNILIKGRNPKITFKPLLDIRKESNAK